MDKIKTVFGGFIRKSSSAHSELPQSGKTTSRDTISRKKEKALKTILEDGLFEVEEEEREDPLAFIKANKSESSTKSLKKSKSSHTLEIRPRKASSESSISKTHSKEIRKIIQKINEETKREKDLRALVDQTLDNIKNGIPRDHEKALKGEIAGNTTFRVLFKEEVVRRNLPMAYRDFLPPKDRDEATREIIANLFRNSKTSSESGESSQRSSMVVDEVASLKKLIRSQN